MDLNIDNNAFEHFVDRSEDFENKVPLEKKKKKKKKNVDSEFLDNKLLGYTLVHPKRLNKHDHCRVTKNKYQEEGRKCIYCIIQDIKDDGTLIVNGYKSTYPNWTINPRCKFKQHRFYLKTSN